jgi:hypothetical protein
VVEEDQPELSDDGQADRLADRVGQPFQLRADPS